MTIFPWEQPKSAQPKYRIQGWLRGLKRVWRENEEVRIRMPLDGPVSTEELAHHQGFVDEQRNCLMELGENCEELLGSCQELEMSFSA